MALYLMCVYGDQNQRTWFEAEWKKAGKKLDMGKSCVRFKKLDDLALDVIGETIRRVTARKYIEICERALSSRQKAPAKKAAAVARPANRSPRRRKRRRKNRVRLGSDSRTALIARLTAQTCAAFGSVRLDQRCVRMAECCGTPRS